MESTSTIRRSQTPDCIYVHIRQRGQSIWIRSQQSKKWFIITFPLKKTHPEVNKLRNYSPHPLKNSLINNFFLSLASLLVFLSRITFWTPQINSTRIGLTEPLIPKCYLGRPDAGPEDGRHQLDDHDRDLGLGHVHLAEAQRARHVRLPVRAVEEGHRAETLNKGQNIQGVNNLTSLVPNPSILLTWKNIQLG